MQPIIHARSFPWLTALALLCLFASPLLADRPPPGERLADPLPGASQPGERPMTLPEFRDVLDDIAYFADGVREMEAIAHGTTITPEGLQSTFAAFPDEQLQQILEALPDPWKLQATASRMRAQIDMAPGLGPDWDPPRTHGLVLDPQTPYPPGYGTSASYNLYTATLPGLGYVTDTDGDGALNDERCNADIANLIIANEALEIASVIADYVCWITDQNILGVPLPVSLVTCPVAAGLKQALNIASIPVEQCAFVDAWIDGSEIQAAHENTLKLLNQIQCVPAATPRRGGACNGVDDDCDQVIDECDEDGFGPDIVIDASVAARWFQSLTEATAAVAAATHAKDDCGIITVSVPSLSGSCGAITATVMATDACGHSNQASALVKVDGLPPTITINPVVGTSCFATIAAAEAAVLAAATIADGCTPASELDIQVDSALSNCSLRVRIQVTDLAGNRAIAAVTVKVDPKPPTVDIDDAVSIPWYADTVEATAAVGRAVSVADECGTVTLSAPSLSGSCGAITATVTATDACGLTSQATANVKVDGMPPTIVINPAVEANCYPTIAAAEAAVRAAATISDDCTPLARLDVRLDSTVSECRLRVRIEAIDLAGHRSIAAATVKVDPKPPVVHIDSAVSVPWHANAAEASAAVARAVFATDDCGPVTVGAPVLAGTCGNVTATVTVTDACGNVTVVSTVVQIDGTAPVIVILPALSSMCFADISSAEATVLATSTITDDCTPLGRLNVKVTSTVTECTLRVQLEATDRAGHRTVAAVTVATDTNRPEVEIQPLLLGFRGEVLGFQTPRCYATVAEAEQAVLAATRFRDACTGADQISVSVASAGPDCALEVTVTGSDDCGNLDTDSVTVRVDANAPVVTTSVTTASLWPPNHEMVDVGFAYTATDDCAGDLAIQIRVTSDERTASADGAGQTSPSPDAEILRHLDGSLAGIRVRAERSESGDGRVYGIHVTATDPCGNSTTRSSSVSVAPNRSRSAVDSGQYYDATAVN